MRHSGITDGGRGKGKQRWILGVAGCLLLVLVVVGGWFGWTQRNNIRALYLAMTQDQNTLTQMQEEQDRQQEELLNQYGLTKPDTSQLQQEQSVETDPSSEQSDNQTGGQTGTSGASGGQTGESSQTGTSEKTDAEKAQAEIQGYVNQLYQVEDKFLARLDEIIAQTKQEYKDLPAAQRTQKKKISLVQSKMSILLAEESKCDAEVEAILANIQATQKKYGQSNDLVSQIRAYYEDSKANWKAAKMTELYS